MRFSRLLVTVCAAVAVCAGCSAASSSEITSAPEADVSPTSNAGQSEPGGAAASGEQPTTLDDYLGLAANAVRGGQGGAAGRAFDEDQALEQQRRVQQEIQICMQAQGFLYQPEEVGDGLRFFLATQASDESGADYAATEGFGISTRFDSLLEGEIELTESTSPNDEHLETLSEGEADAWQFALRGAPPERNEQGQLVDPETGEAVQGRQAPGGCTGDAQEAVRGDAEALADLAQDFDELEERIAADPRMTEIARAWTDCMRAGGFDFQDESEARAEINQEFRPLLRSFFQSAATGDQGQQGQGQQGQGQQGQGQEGQGGGNRLQAIAGLELTAEQEVELEALQERERAMAVTSATCQGDTDDEVAEITAGYEAEFVETNRAALEALSG